MSRTRVSTTVDGIMGGSMGLLGAALLGAPNAAVGAVCHQGLLLLVRRIRMARACVQGVDMALDRKPHRRGPVVAAPKPRWEQRP